MTLLEIYGKSGKNLDGNKKFNFPSVGMVRYIYAMAGLTDEQCFKDIDVYTTFYCDDTHARVVDLGWKKGEWPGEHFGIGLMLATKPGSRGYNRRIENPPPKWLVELCEQCIKKYREQEKK